VAITDRHEQREPVQPLAMQVAEGRLEQAIIGLAAQQDAGAARPSLPPCSLCGAMWSRGV
jgi:hypothetical protein